MCDLIIGVAAGVAGVLVVVGGLAYRSYFHLNLVVKLKVCTFSKKRNCAGENPPKHHVHRTSHKISNLSHMLPK